MTVINPIWLWGLTGLIVPVAIHLLSRREGTVIPVGSVRHFKESATAHFRSIRLNEYLLLLLRCLIITLLVLMIAGLDMDLKDRKRNWVLVEKDVPASGKTGMFIDSLIGNGFEGRYLSPGFPELDDSSNPQPVRSYWTLAEQLQQEDLDSVIVISHNYSKFFEGKRIPKKSLHWIGSEPARDELIVHGGLMSDDSVFVRKGIFSPERTLFQTQKFYRSQFTSGVEIPPTDTIRIVIVSDNLTAYERKIILAALNAVQTTTSSRILISEMKPASFKNPDVHWVIWLSMGNMPGEIRTSTKTMGMGTCQSDHLPILVDAFTSPECKTTQSYDWVFTQPVNEETALDKRLAETMALVILPGKERLINEYDRRVEEHASIWSPARPSGTSLVRSVKRKNGDPFIFMILMITFFLERWISFKRNQ